MTLDCIISYGDDARVTTERIYLSSALKRCEYNISATARDLDCPRSSLRRVLGRHPDLVAMCER